MMMLVNSQVKKKNEEMFASPTDIISPTTITMQKDLPDNTTVKVSITTEGHVDGNKKLVNGNAKDVGGAPSDSSSSSTRSTASGSSAKATTTTTTAPVMLAKTNADGVRDSQTSVTSQGKGKSHTLIQLQKPAHKRIIVCCDGTWQDGIESKYRWQYSNILKLSRSFHREDQRGDHPIQQVVFYQAGVGTDNNLYSELVGGATGAGLGEKVQDVYCFIAHNYAPGDEIFLFGFSRGAYTARMVADFIGAIGILDKRDMDHFAEIFINYQLLGKASSEREKRELREKMKGFIEPTCRGKQNAEHGDRPFSVKCLGVFDTVGSIGLPGQFLTGSEKTKLFGFNDLKLGAHIERGYQALALNERRMDFEPAKWTQTDLGREKGQVMHQCWFTGAHTDIGGGYMYHDLSDITLAWMIANIEDTLAVDMDYLKNLHADHHIAKYAEQLPHDSSTGVFAIAKSADRSLPTDTNTTTHEYIHPSALACKHIRPDLQSLLSTNPNILWKLKPFEEQIRDTWAYDPRRAPKSEESKEAAKEERDAQKSFVKSMKRRTGSVMRSVSLRRNKVDNNTMKNTEDMRRKAFGGGPSVHIVDEPKPATTSWFASLLENIQPSG